MELTTLLTQTRKTLKLKTPREINRRTVSPSRLPPPFTATISRLTASTWRRTQLTFAHCKGFELPVNDDFASPPASLKVLLLSTLLLHEAVAELRARALRTEVATCTADAILLVLAFRISL
jgi:hypothetical protein